MRTETLFGHDWYQDPNDNRIHDENGDDILDKHSLGELQKAVNNHDALVAALKLVAYRYESGDIGDLINDMPEIEAALEQVK